MTLSSTQKQMFEAIDDEGSISLWRNWKWQIQNSIQSQEELERLLDLKLSDGQRADFQRTVDKFPMSVTPYYLSLIDTDNFANDPIFRQSIPSPLELELKKTIIL